MWITQWRLVSYVKNCTPERQFVRSRSCVVRLIQFSNGSCLVYYLTISPAFSLFSLQYSIWISIQSLSRSGTMATVIVPGHCREEAKWAHEGQPMGVWCKSWQEKLFVWGQMMDGSSPLPFTNSKNIMFTSVFIMHVHLWSQGLHNSDDLMELQYHVFADTLGVSANLIGSHLRCSVLIINDHITCTRRLSVHTKLASLLKWKESAPSAWKYLHYSDSKGKKDEWNSIVRRKLSIGIGLSSAKQHHLKPPERAANTT